MVIDCACMVVVCGWAVADTRVGDAGAVALAKALESGQCQLKELVLRSESTLLAACATRCRWATLHRLSVGTMCALEAAAAGVDGDRLRVWLLCVAG